MEVIVINRVMFIVFVLLTRVVVQKSQHQPLLRDRGRRSTLRSRLVSSLGDWRMARTRYDLLLPDTHLVVYQTVFLHIVAMFN